TTIIDDDTASVRIFDLTTGGVFTLKRTGANIELFQGTTRIASEPTGAYSLTINGTAADDQTLIVDLSGGNPLPDGGVIFNGGTGGHDVVNLQGGTVDTATFTFTNASDGNIDLSGLGTIT